MIAMDVMQAAVDHEVDVVPMEDLGMTTGLVGLGIFTGRHAADVGIGCGHLQTVFVEMIPVNVAKQAIMKEIFVIAVPDPEVAAALAVHVLMGDFFSTSVHE